MKKIAAASLAALMLAGCASSAESIHARHVSEARFHGYDCQQVAEEMRQVDARLADLSSRQNANAAGDAALMTVGLIVFWPALIGMAATNDYADEIGTLKGERETLERVAIRKKCAETLELEDLMDAEPIKRERPVEIVRTEP